MQRREISGNVRGLLVAQAQVGHLRSRVVLLRVLDPCVDPIDIRLAADAGQLRALGTQPTILPLVHVLLERGWRLDVHQPLVDDVTGHAPDLADEFLAVFGIALHGRGWIFRLIAHRKEEIRDGVHFNGVAIGCAGIVFQPPESRHVRVGTERDGIRKPLADPPLVRLARDLVEARAGLAQCADRDIDLLTEGQGNFLRETVEPSHVGGVYVVKLANAIEVFARRDVMRGVRLQLLHLVARPTTQLLDEPTAVIELFAALEIGLVAVTLEATGLHVLRRAHRLEEKLLLFPIVILPPSVTLRHLDNVRLLQRRLLQFRVVVIVIRMLLDLHP